MQGHVKRRDNSIYTAHSRGSYVLFVDGQAVVRRQGWKSEYPKFRGSNSPQVPQFIGGYGFP